MMRAGVLFYGNSIIEPVSSTAAGQSIRKVVVNSGITEERIYLGGLEIYRKFDSTGSLTLECTTVHISDDKRRIAMLKARTFGMDGSEAELKRFIHSNHLQSASP